MACGRQFWLIKIQRCCSKENCCIRSSEQTMKVEQQRLFGNRGNDKYNKVDEYDGSKTWTEKKFDLKIIPYQTGICIRTPNI